MALKLLFSAWFRGKSELFVPILRYEKTFLLNKIFLLPDEVIFRYPIFLFCLTGFHPLAFSFAYKVFLVS